MDFKKYYLQIKRNNISTNNLELKIPGVNKGRNSYSAIYKSTYTKFSNNTINNISIKTFGKSIATQIVTNPIGFITSTYFKNETEDILVCR